jgi:hypothetical protein
MPALYDLPTLLNQNTEGINFSAHLRLMAMAFQVAVHTFVVRSRLREVRTMPSVECELFAVTISHHPIVLMRSAAVRFEACRVNPSMLQVGGIYRRNLARTFRQDYSFVRLGMRGGEEGKEINRQEDE